MPDHQAAHRPTITDWLQAWGILLSLAIGGGALLISAITLREQQQMNKTQGALNQQQAEANKIQNELNSSVIERGDRRYVNRISTWTEGSALGETYPGIKIKLWVQNRSPIPIFDVVAVLATDAGGVDPVVIGEIEESLRGWIGFSPGGMIPPCTAMWVEFPIDKINKDPNRGWLKGLNLSPSVEGIRFRESGREWFLNSRGGLTSVVPQPVKHDISIAGEFRYQLREIDDCGEGG